jgi:hypothetical protein
MKKKKNDNRLLSGEMLSKIDKSNIHLSNDEKEWFNDIHKKHATYSLCKTFSYNTQKYGVKTRIKSVAAFTLKDEALRTKLSEILTKNGIAHTFSDPKKLANPPKYIFINGMESIYKLILMANEPSNVKMNAMRGYILNHDKPELIDSYLTHFGRYAKKNPDKNNLTK